MTRGNRIAAWCGTSLSGLTIVGLTVYYVIAGLDRADKVASIISSLIGILGIWIAIYAAFKANAVARNGMATGVRQSQRSGNESINLQAGGDMQIGDKNKFGK